MVKYCTEGAGTIILQLVEVSETILLYNIEPFIPNARQSLYIKQISKEPEVASNLKAADFRALRDLNLLLQENASLDGMWEEDLESEEEMEGDPIKKFKRKSHSFPPLNQNPALALFVRQITKEII